jgi:hypothetical protein
MDQIGKGAGLNCRRRQQADGQHHHCLPPVIPNRHG